MAGEIAAGIARIGAYYVWDRMSGTRPRSLPAIPPSFKSLNAEWLTDALCTDHPGAKVVSFTMDGATSGSTSRTFVNLIYNEAGDRAGLPRRIFAKASPSFSSRMIGLSGCFEVEVAFFHKIRPLLNIEAPESYFAAVHPPSQRSMVLLKVLDGATFFNPKFYIDRGDAEGMVGVLADLHATFWNSPRLRQEFTWVRTALQYQIDMDKMVGFTDRCKDGIDRSAQVIPDKILKKRDEIWPLNLRSLEMNGQGDQTLLHFDVHIGNWYKTAAGQMGLSDWQTQVRGNWACDFAYAISCALTVEDRRAWERDLLKLYLEKLHEAGVAEVPEFDAAWLLYRQQLYHGFTFWVFTIGRSALQPKMQPDEFSLLNIERFANAMDDLDSIAALEHV